MRHLQSLSRCLFQPLEAVTSQNVNLLLTFYLFENLLYSHENNESLT